MIDYKEITLSNGLTVKVNPEDHPELSRYHWYGNHSGGKTYAMTHGIKSETGGPSALHRVVMGATKGEEVIFRDRDPLNCQRNNLVKCLRADVLHNQAVNRRNSTGYKGVSRLASGKFRAYICIGGKREYLGTHATAGGAARAYNARAREAFGSFARLNDIPEGE